MCLWRCLCKLQKSLKSSVGFLCSNQSICWKPEPLLSIHTSLLSRNLTMRPSPVCFFLFSAHLFALYRCFVMSLWPQSCSVRYLSFSAWLHSDGRFKLWFPDLISLCWSSYICKRFKVQKSWMNNTLKEHPYSTESILQNTPTWINLSLPIDLFSKWIRQKSKSNLQVFCLQAFSTLMDNAIQLA